jgi:hypothetical protein
MADFKNFRLCVMYVLDLFSCLMLLIGRMNLLFCGFILLKPWCERVGIGVLLNPEWLVMICLLDVVDCLHEFAMLWVHFIKTLVWKSWHWCLTISWMTCDDFLAWCCWLVARICYFAGSLYSNLGVKELALVSYYLLNDLWCLDVLLCIISSCTCLSWTVIDFVFRKFTLL